MIFDYTANPFGAATGQAIGILYEFASGSSGPPPTGPSIEDRIRAGSSFGATLRETSIGGFN